MTARAARALQPRVAWPCSCGGAARAEPDATRRWPERVACGACGHTLRPHPEGALEDGGLRACIACGHPELYRRKRFPPAVGLTIVAVAAVAAPFTHYISLAVAAILDAVLFAFTPDELACYECGAAHRGFAETPKHPRFDREIEERLKFGERAVMGKPMRPGGTAGAPEPEH